MRVAGGMEAVVDTAAGECISAAADHTLAVALPTAVVVDIIGDQTNCAERKIWMG